MWVGNLMLVVLNLPMIGIWIKLLTVPYRLLYPAILLFCAIGVYTINNTSFDVMQTAFFGFLGVLFVKLACEPAPLLLGFVLGPMMEENLRRAMLLSRGDPTVFLHPAAVRGDARRRRAADRRHRAAQHPPQARGSVPGRVTNRMTTGSAARAADIRLVAAYASRRQPVFARNAVATSQPLATQAGIAMLARGGNAVDAALATAITLTVVEPCSNGIGSDLFAILWDGERTRRPECVGPRARGVVAERDSRGQHRDARARLGHGDDSRRGLRLGRAVEALRQAAVRGPVRARDPLRARRLSRVAGRRGEMGARGAADAAGPGLARALPAARPRAAAGRALRLAARWPRTLEIDRATHGDAFYRGELAQAMVAHSQANGGAHTLADFAAHAADWVTPLAQDYRGMTVHEIPPNGQGISALMALGMLEHFDLASLPPDSVASQHLQIEAMKLAFADAYRYVSDPRTMPVPPAALLDRDYLARARAAHRSDSARRTSVRASRRAAAPSTCAPPTRAA